MKMICKKAGTCKHVVCPGLVPHEKNDECDTHVCGGCEPVRHKRKPGTVWRIYIDFDSRADARAEAKCLREECWHHDGQIRGPVKVSFP